MNNMAKLFAALSIIILSIGIGASISASQCTPEDCDTTIANSITEGTSVHFQGPELSPQGRPLKYEWNAYLCDGTGITLTDATGNVEGIELTGRDLVFYAPPEGYYKVFLTVMDKEFPLTCKDTKTICFTTKHGDCPTLCCGEVCEKDTPDYSTCPWHMAYTGNTADYTFKWLIDGIVYKSGTGVSAKSVDIDWTAPKLIAADGTTEIPLGYGLHPLGFQVYAPNPSGGDPIKIMDCTTSCSCKNRCNVYKVQKPTAEITQVS